MDLKFGGQLDIQISYKILQLIGLGYAIFALFSFNGKYKKHGMQEDSHKSSKTTHLFLILFVHVDVGIMLLYTVEFCLHILTIRLRHL